MYRAECPVQPCSLHPFLCRRAINAIQFVSDGRYINPSRVNPTILSTKDLLGNQTRFLAEVQLNGKWEAAVFVTPIRVLQSHIREGLRGQKFVSGAAHGQEWERMAAVFCMIIGEQVVQAQVVGCDLSFSTKTAGTRVSCTLFLVTQFRPSNSI